MQIKNNDNTLYRGLGLFTSTMIVVGVMIGTGVFKKIIPLAQTGLSANYILLAWLVAGIITILGALNLAALATLTSSAGGIYEYLRLAFGNFFSFIYGFTDFTIIGNASVAAVAYIFAQTINTLVPLPNPLQSLAHIQLFNFIHPFENSGIKIVAVSTIIILTLVNYKGVKETGLLNNIITILKILGMLGIIIFGLFIASPPSNYVFETVKPIETNSLFIAAFFTALLNILWAYDGWLDISFLTGEIKNPKKNLPLAAFIGISIAAIIYMLINYVYMHIVPVQTLAQYSGDTIGAAVVANAMFGDVGKTLITVLIMVCVLGSLNGIMLSHTRVYFRMAQEKYFFKQAAYVHPKFKSPSKALIFTMVWSCILVFSGTFDMLTDMIIFASFLFYGMLAVAVLKFKRNGTIKNNVIAYPLIQIILILFSAALMVNTVIAQPHDALIGVFLIAIAVPFYFYFEHHKKILKH